MEYRMLKMKLQTRHRKNFQSTKTVPVFRNALRFLKEKYTDIEDYSSWQEDTIPANKITLVNNGTHAGPKTPLVLQTIRYLAQNAENVTIQTPYVICNGYMYDTLNEIASHAQLKIILNAVEKAPTPGAAPTT